MASSSRRETTTGKVYYKLQFSRGKGKTPLSMNWYPDEKWSKKKTERELRKAKEEFERKCKAGEILTRQERKEKEEQEKREAEKRAAEERKNLTFLQYYEQVYLPQHGYLSESTVNIRNYTVHLYCVPLHNKILSSITPLDIEDVLASERVRNLALNSRRNTYSFLSTLFNSALRDGTVSRNPMESVDMPRPNKDKEGPESAREVRCLTSEEIVTLIDAAIEISPMVFTLVILLLETGMRIGEALALTWEDIDFKNNIITVSKTSLDSRDVKITAPKDGITRRIDFGDSLKEVLIKWKKIRPQSRLNKCDFLFPAARKPKPIRQGTLSAEGLAKLKLKANMPWFRWHLLRHTCASLAVQGNANIAALAARLGHESATTTMVKYVHTTDESIRKAGDSLRKLLDGGGTESPREEE